jgi:ABC-type bacteriocin/lantibiotic exporter with double-glycine peptidase domain
VHVYDGGSTMDGIIDYFTAHQLNAAACIFVAILIIYFLFKKLVKLALLFILAIIILTGYAYFKESHRMPRSIHEALHKAKEETRMVVEKGRGAYDSVMAIFEKRRKPVTDYIDKITEEDKEAYKKKPAPAD